MCQSCSLNIFSASKLPHRGNGELRRKLVLKSEVKNPQHPFLEGLQEQKSQLEIFLHSATIFFQQMLAHLTCYMIHTFEGLIQTNQFLLEVSKCCWDEIDTYKQRGCLNWTSPLSFKPTQLKSIELVSSFIFMKIPSFTSPTLTSALFTPTLQLYRSLRRYRFSF